MKRKKLDYILRIQLPIVLFVALLTFATTYFVTNPVRQVIGYAPEQPIAFSHELHAGQMKIDCQYCHVGADKSRHALIPSVDTCMNCHSVARADTPMIKQLAEYAKEEKSIEWKRVHKLPDFVYFNHSVHVNRDIPCQSCHGPVEKMDTTTKVRSFSMADCLDCHRNAHDQLEGKLDEHSLKDIKNGPEYCAACHR